MKLFSLPYVVQREVLDLLTIGNIFFLSLCSKNTKNFILRTQKYQLQKIERIKYHFNGKTRAIRVETVANGCPNVEMVLINTLDYEEFTKQIFGPLEEVRVNELDTAIDFFRSAIFVTDFYAKYCSANMKQTIAAIHSHLWDLLGNHTKFWLCSTSREANALPMLPNIQLIKVFGDSFEPTEIDEFVEGSTCLEYLSWLTVEKTDIELRENSRVYDLHTVYLWSDSRVATDIMKHFNGRHAFLRGSEIDTTEVIQFLNAWTSGEKYRHLEVISMENEFRLAEIRDSVELKELNTKVEFSFIRKCPEFQPYMSERYSWELKSHLYVVRKSDDRVASVLLTDERVFMGVWNVEEKEFLEQFQ